MKRKKLIKAIKYISKVCSQHDNCSTCPMMIGEWKIGEHYCLFELNETNSESLEPALWAQCLKDPNLKLNSIKEDKNDE